MHNHVILGPLLLLNHACRDRAHYNVDCDYVDNHLIEIRDVDAGDELIVEYADECYLASRMGFSCKKCNTGIINIWNNIFYIVLELILSKSVNAPKFIIIIFNRQGTKTFNCTAKSYY